MAENDNRKPLLVVEDLKQHFKVSGGYTVRAVEGVSFEIYAGETYGPVRLRQINHRTKHYPPL